MSVYWGAVVYQARALYSNLYDTYQSYVDCPSEAAGRMNAPTTVSKTLQVVLKSELFPNPNEGNFSLRFKNIPVKERVEITIFDLTGRTIIKEIKIPETNNELNYKTNLINGTYLVKVNFVDGSYDLHRLVISK